MRGTCAHGAACFFRPSLSPWSPGYCSTSYSGGRVVPSLGMFYDWQGAIVFQPGVQLVRDPFRFIFDYTRIEGAPTGQFGAVRDRDNVRFQVEFVF